jgi:hypothetical protein
MIKLGNVVEDKVTGLVGMATQLYYRSNGNRLIAVQPKGDGKSIHDVVFFDDFSLIVLENGIADEVPGIATTNIEIGMEVVEVASGQTGLVTSKTIHLNGCINFEVTTKSVDNKSPELFWVDHTRLQIVSDGITKEIKKTPQTGGPMLRGMMKQR